MAENYAHMLRELLFSDAHFDEGCPEEEARDLADQVSASCAVAAGAERGIHGSEFGHSSCKELAKHFGAPSLARDYVFPGGRSAAETERDLYPRQKLLFRMKALAQGDPWHAKWYGPPKPSAHSTAARARQWFRSFCPDPAAEAAALNDQICELNPELAGVPRNRCDLESECHFFMGAMYRKPPADIAWFLLTRHDTEDPELEADILSHNRLISTAGLDLLNQALPDGKKPVLRAGTILSPQSIESALADMGRSDLWPGIDELPRMGARIVAKLTGETPESLLPAPWISKMILEAQEISKAKAALAISGGRRARPPTPRP